MDTYPALLNDLHNYVFGGLCIAVYACSRFNTPATWRSTTTSWQYMLALAGYLVSALALWFVLAKLIETNPKVVEILTLGSLDLSHLPNAAGGADKTLAEQLSGLSAQLVSAVILTVLLPRFPILSKLDLMMQRVFRELGAIPRQARQLSKMLRRAQYTPPHELLPEVRSRLTEQGLDPNRILRSECQSLEWQWMRIVALMCKLEEAVDLDEEPGDESDEGDNPSPRPALRSAFIRHRELEFVRLCAAYKRQAAVASVLLKTPEETEQDQIARAFLDPDDGADSSMRRLQQSFRDECKRLIRDLTRLISCGVLRSNFSLAATFRELRAWGFGPLSPTVQGVSADELIGITLAITCYLFVLFLFIHAGTDRINQAPMLALTIGLTMTAAVICALYPKKAAAGWGAQQGKGRNFSMYLVSGLLAIGCWMAIFYIRFMLTTGKGFSDVLEELYWRWPFAVLPFAAAFTIAWMADNRPDAWGIPAAAMRWGEALILAAVLAGAAYVAFTYVQELQATMPTEMRPPRRTSLVTIMLIQAGLGFIIGSLVPHLYRKASLEASVQEADRKGTGAMPGRASAALAQGG